MPPDALLPEIPMQPPVEPPMSPEMEAMLLQNERQHDETMSSLDVLIQQTAKNDPEPLLDTLIQQTDDVKAAVTETGKQVAEAVKSTKPEISEAIAAALEGIELAKKREVMKGNAGERGEKGEKGDKGDQGDAGKDGVDGADGLDGERGEQGPVGMDGRDGLDGMQGPMGPQGVAGKDGSPDSGTQIVEKLSALEGNDRLSFHDLKDIPTMYRKDVPVTNTTSHQASRSYAFTELTDVPQSFSGQSGKVLRVNSAETALEFTDNGVTRIVAGTNISVSPTTGVGDVTVNVTGMPVDAFVQGGNSFATTAVIGTNDNQALAFDTNNIERMRILTNGRVGFGTNNPQAVVDARGQVYAEINSLNTPGHAFSNATTYGIGYISGNLLLIAGTVPALVLTPISSNYRIPRDWTYSWSANVGNDNFPDTGISRTSANRIAMGNGAAGNITATVAAARFQGAKGASVAAANDLTLGSDGQTFVITGNTQVNAITTSGWNTGSEINLIFTGTPTVKHNTAGGAGTVPLLLSAGVDLTASNPTVLRLVYDGTNWQEVSRSVNHA